MNTTVLSPKKSMNVRPLYSWPTVRRRLVTAYGTLLPDPASRLFERLFLTPRRAVGPVAVDGPFAPLRARKLPYAGRWLRVWETGPGKTSGGEEAVVLVHGWAGQAAQLSAFAAPLVAAGYRVVAFDAPAHGLSDGDRTDMLDFAGAVLQVAGQACPVRGVIAHSFGSPAVALALRHGLGVGKVVCIAPPTSLEIYSRVVSRFVGMPERARAKMQARVEKRFGVAWRDLETHRLFGQAALARPFDLLVVHDSGDREVPWSNGARITEAVPGAQMLTTQGLGHNKLLRDPATVGRIVDFLRND